MKTFIKSYAILLCLCIFYMVSAQGQVVVTPLCGSIPIIAYDTVLCKGGKIRLMTETDWNSYQWSSNGVPITSSGTSDVYVASAAGTYSVTARTGTTCATASKIITASVKTAPAAPTIVATSTVICQGAISLSVKDTVGVTAYQWGINGGILVDDTNSHIVPYYTGTYFVSIKASNGCTNDTVSEQITLSTQVETPTITAYTSEAILLASNVSSSNVSYQWYAEGRAIVNYTSATMPLYYNATYNVEVTYPGGCRMFSADYVQKGLSKNLLRVATVVTDSTITLPAVGRTGFEVYPNPSNGSFAIDYSSAAGSSVTIRLYSSAGVLVNSWSFESTSGQFYETITTQNLVAGIYMLTLSDGQNSYTNKLVIE